jgi:hypothetical protein
MVAESVMRTGTDAAGELSPTLQTVRNTFV